MLAKRCLIVGVALLCSFVFSLANAQQTKKSLSVEDLERLLRDKVSPGAIVRLLDERGVSFELTGDVKDRLRAAGASVEVVRALERSTLELERKNLEELRRRADEERRRAEEERQRLEQERRKSESPSPRPSHVDVVFVNDTQRELAFQISGSEYEIGGHSRKLLRPNESTSLRLSIGQHRLRVNPTTSLGPLVFGQRGFEKWVQVNQGVVVRIAESDFR